jgi:hypothetical protein
MWYKDNRIINNLPVRLEIDGRVIFNPKWGHFETAGYKEFPESLQSVDRRFIKWVDGDPVEMSQEEKDNILASDFVENKKQKLMQIDERTREIINQGFEFDGVMISLSPNSQNMFTGLSLALEKGYIGEANFPYEITTLDDNKYDLSWELRDMFFGLVLYYISTRLAAGRALKVQVINTTTQEELDLIIDNR